MGPEKHKELGGQESDNRKANPWIEGDRTSSGNCTFTHGGKIGLSEPVVSGEAFTQTEEPSTQMQSLPVRLRVTNASDIRNSDSGDL